MMKYCMSTILAVALFIFAACSGGDTLKIGVLLPPTNSTSMQGDSERAAIDLAVSDVNKYFASKNSFKRVEAVIKDTQDDPTVIVNDFNELHSAGINMTVASLVSENLNLAQDVIASNNMVVINSDSTSPALSIADNIFRLVPDDNYLSSVMTSLFSSSGIEKIVILYRNDLWGTTLSESITTTFTANSGEVLASIPYDSQTYGIDIREYLIEPINTAITDALVSCDASKIRCCAHKF